LGEQGSIEMRRRPVISLASQSSRFERHPNKLLIPVQVRTENRQLRTDNW
jgi:hypothetical protein